MCAIHGHYTRLTLAGFLILALWFEPLVSGQVVSPIPAEELKFISLWTKLTVDQLKQYEASTSKILIKFL